jgi:hypothetical protein
LRVPGKSFFSFESFYTFSRAFLFLPFLSDDENFPDLFHFSSVIPVVVLVLQARVRVSETLAGESIEDERI